MLLSSIIYGYPSEKKRTLESLLLSVTEAEKWIIFFFQSRPQRDLNSTRFSEGCRHRPRGFVQNMVPVRLIFYDNCFEKKKILNLLLDFLTLSLLFVCLFLSLFLILTTSLSLSPLSYCPLFLFFSPSHTLHSLSLSFPISLIRSCKAKNDHKIKTDSTF